jgi:exodeoxyribonuclease VII large subunit
VADMVASREMKTPTAVAEFLVEQLLAFFFRLTSLHDRLTISVKGRVQGALTNLERIRSRLEYLGKGLLFVHSEQLNQQQQRLDREIRNQLMRKKEQLAHIEKRNELMDPLNILKRGYSMTLLDGRAISSVEQLLPGQLLETRLHRGSVLSKVEQTRQNHDKRKNKL